MTPLDRLAAMVAEMTPGPWEYSCGTIGQDYEPWGDVVGIEDDGVSWTPTRSLVLKPEDAAGIVALRNAAEELIAVARAAQKLHGGDRERDCDCGVCKLADALAALVEAKLAGEQRGDGDAD